MDESSLREASQEEAFLEQSSRRSRRRLRLLLDGGSFSLFAIFLVRLAAVLLEMQPANPDWQAKVVTTLVNQAPLAFLGFVLLHLASFVQPSHDALRRRLRLVRRLAVIPVIGFFLLIPLQITSYVGDLSANQAAREKYLSRAARLSEIREAIQQGKTMQDINVRLQSLLEPALTADQMDLSLPDLRKALLKENDASQQQISRRLKFNADNLDSFSEVFSRVGSAFGWALAFASGAVPWGARSTVLEQVKRRGSAAQGRFRGG